MTFDSDFAYSMNTILSSNTFKIALLAEDIYCLSLCDSIDEETLCSLYTQDRRDCHPEAP